MCLQGFCSNSTTASDSDFSAYLLMLTLSPVDCVTTMPFLSARFPSRPDKRRSGYRGAVGVIQDEPVRTPLVFDEK